MRPRSLSLRLFVSQHVVSCHAGLVNGCGSNRMDLNLSTATERPIRTSVESYGVKLKLFVKAQRDMHDLQQIVLHDLTVCQFGKILGL